MQLRETARRIFLETLEQLCVPKVMRNHVRCEGGILHIGEKDYPMGGFRRIKIVSVGKAAVPMAAALTEIISPQIMPGQSCDGIVVGATMAEDPRFQSFLGGHPLPNDQSLLAGTAVLKYLSDSDSNTLVVFLISGGASTMLEQPLDTTMTMEDIVTFHQVLVHSGLRIQEMNALRKHFSAVKGGRLAVAAGGATKCTLLISDVPGDALHIIGSGPTLPDPSTLQDCLTIFAEHQKALPLPDKVLRFFNREIVETPKENNAAFHSGSSFSLLSTEAVCAEARRLAEREGFTVVVDNACDEWPYDKAAEYLLHRMANLRKMHGKVCLLSAGEISVEIRGEQGIGGRNQHFLLECARRMAMSGERMTILSAGTDGIDGNSRAAGGLIDETTGASAAEHGLSVSAALERFDSNTLLDAIGSTVMTGPTGNNIRDLRILLSAR